LVTSPVNHYDDLTVSLANSILPLRVSSHGAFF